MEEQLSEVGWDVAGRYAPKPVWFCPVCGSDNLTIYYSERRASAVNRDPDYDEPWPSVRFDEFIEFDVDSFRYGCDSCLQSDITPVRRDTPTEADSSGDGLACPQEAPCHAPDGDEK